MFPVPAVFSLALALLLSSSGVADSAPDASPSYPRLAAGFEPLRSAFNGDAGRVRLLLLLDPT